MSDRKTAAELRAMASVSLQPGWRSLCVHLAAVEEEREAACASGMSGIDAAIASARLEDVQCELEVMMCVADEQRERAKRAERDAKAYETSLFDTANTLHATVDLVTEERRLAADALRVGLEECERLRVERDAWMTTARARGAREVEQREKVGEWWEVRHPCSPFIPKRWTTRELARGACSEGGKVVHVTRWRKKR